MRICLHAREIIWPFEMTTVYEGFTTDVFKNPLIKGWHLKIWLLHCGIHKQVKENQSKSIGLLETWNTNKWTGKWRYLNSGAPMHVQILCKSETTRVFRWSRVIFVSLFSSNFMPFQTSFKPFVWSMSPSSSLPSWSYLLFFPVRAPQQSFLGVNLWK